MPSTHIINVSSSPPGGVLLSALPVDVAIILCVDEFVQVPSVVSNDLLTTVVVKLIRSFVCLPDVVDCAVSTVEDELPPVEYADVESVNGEEDKDDIEEEDGEVNNDADEENCCCCSIVVLYDVACEAEQQI